MCVRKNIKRKGKRVFSNGDLRCLICEKYNNDHGFVIKIGDDIKNKYFCSNLCYVIYIEIKRKNMINF